MFTTADIAMKFNVFNNIDGIPNKIYTDNVSIINIPEV